MTDKDEIVKKWLFIAETDLKTAQHEFANETLLVPKTSLFKRINARYRYKKKN